MLLGELYIIQGELRINPNQFLSGISDPMRREERTTVFSQYSNFMRKQDRYCYSELCIVEAELPISDVQGPARLKSPSLGSAQYGSGL